MSVEIVQERLESYDCASALEEEQALREISQEIILAGLGRTDFFGKAAFQGGTCLRIFHGLNRFSEDLDFALRVPDPAFELLPYLEQVRVFDLPSLFAGKIHALLCRDYLKGRDWYDFIWYTARRTPINHGLLSPALHQQGPWAGSLPSTDNAWCITELSTAIEAIDWPQARADVQRFLKPRELPSLELWSTEFFLGQCRKL